MLITIKEYDYLTRNDNSGSTGISSRDFEYLVDLNSQQNPIEDTKSRSIFIRRDKQLQAQHHVGIIQCPDGMQIEILPKIWDGSTERINDTRNIFLKMLRATGRLPSKVSRNADLLTDSAPLLEILIQDFLQEVDSLVKRGIRSDYIGVEDNLKFLKGKLLIGQQIRHNYIHRDRFYVNYDSFEPERPENRLIKSSLQKVLSMCTDMANQRLCRELLFIFTDISPSDNYAVDFQHCSKDRNMSYYQATLEWCKLILHDEAPIPQAGENSFRCLLFDMPKLFEEYVGIKLKDHLNKDWDIIFQSKKELLLEDQEKNKFFQLKPDFFIKNKKDTRTIIADAKWKRINTIKKTDDSNVIRFKSKFGILQSDLYQIFIYAFYYIKEEHKKVIIIYPATECFKEPEEFNFIDKKCTLYILPFNLEDEDEKINNYLNTPYL